MTGVMTRKEYMAAHGEEYRATRSGLQAHQRYYGQFVTQGLINRVGRFHGEKLLASKDPYFNDLRGEQYIDWDAFCGIGGNKSSPRFSWHSMEFDKEKWREAGETGLSAADLWCIAKEAARIWVERQQTPGNFIMPDYDAGPPEGWGGDPRHGDNGDPDA